MKILNQAKKTWFNIAKTSDSSAEIAIYNDIGMYGITDEMFKAQLDAVGDVRKLTIRLNSYGGEVFAGFAIYNSIKEHSAVDKIVIIDGVAASITSVIALSGTKLLMHKNAFYMIHDPSVMVAGTSIDLRKAAEMLDKIKVTIIDTYKDKKLTLSKEKLNEMMTAETWITADEAKKYGFADEVIENSESDEPENTMNTKRLPENYREICFKPTAMIQNPVNNKPKGANMFICPICGKEHAEGAAFCNHCGSAITAQAKEQVSAQAKARQKEIDEAKAAETKRVTNITAHCKALNLSEKFVNELIKSGETLDQAFEKITAELQDRAADNANPTTLSVVIDASDKFRDHSVKSLSVALNIEKDQKIVDDIRKNPGVRDLHGLARNILIRDGADPMTVASLQPVDLAERVLRSRNSVGSADLPNILADTMNKSFSMQPSEVGATFDQVCAVSENPDFRTKSFTKLSSFGDLDVIPEGGVFKQGGFSDKKETGSITTKGKMITLTRQLIVNNDTGALSAFPRAMITAVYQKMNRDCYDLLTLNNVGPVLTEDSKAVFHTDHNNICTAGAVSISSIDNMEQFLAKQTLPKAKPGDPDTFVFGGVRKILCGTTQKLAALQTVMSTTDPGATNNAKYNPYAGGIQVISDPYLQSLIGAAGGMNKTGAWYGFADSSLFPTLTVLYLSGARTPSLRSEASGIGEAQGLSWEIFFDWGFTFQDYRGIAYNAGA